MSGLSLPFSFADVFAAPAERLWQNGNRAIPAVRVLPLATPWGGVVQKEKIFMNSEVTTEYILAAVFVAAGITFLLRLLPFGLKKALAGSELLDALSHWIPLGAVALLAIYAVAKINYSSFATAAPYLAGLVVTVGVHLWRKNMVLSMVAGTVTCVVLANWVF